MPWQGQHPYQPALRIPLGAYTSLSRAPSALASPGRLAFGWLGWLSTSTALLLLTACLWSALAPVDCRAAPFAFRPNNGIDATMRVTSGRSCIMVARIGSANAQDLWIDTPPQHGTVQPRGRTGITYRAADKFKGDDFFTIALRGRDKSGAGIMTVRVRVAVQ